MKNLQKGFVVPVLLGIIVLLVIGGGVYIYKNKKLEAPATVETGTQPTDRVQQQTNTKTPPANTQTNSQVETSNWKTYIDSEYGFEFKYPEDWKEIKNKKIITGLYSSGTYLLESSKVEDYQKYIVSETNSPGMYGDASASSIIGTTMVWVKPEDCSIDSNFTICDEKRRSEFKEEKFADKEIISVNSLFPFYFIIRNIKHNKGVLFDIGYRNYEMRNVEYQIISKIISTFKFTK